MVEEEDSLFDENRRICGGDLDDQGCAELGDSIPGEEGAGTANCDACGQVHSICYGFLEEGGIRGEGGDRDPIY